MSISIATATLAKLLAQRNVPADYGSAPRRAAVFPGPLCQLTFNEGKPMDVAPHPHIDLQTVT